MPSQYSHVSQGLRYFTPEPPLYVITMSLSFKGHTVVITGAGGGLGKACELAYAFALTPYLLRSFLDIPYSLHRGERMSWLTISTGWPLRKSLTRLRKVGPISGYLVLSNLLVGIAGGKAVVNTSSVTDGAAVIQSALDTFGGVTILLNNAGILRDKGSGITLPGY